MHIVHTVHTVHTVQTVTTQYIPLMKGTSFMNTSSLFVCSAENVQCLKVSFSISNKLKQIYDTKLSGQVDPLTQDPFTPTPMQTYVCLLNHKEQSINSYKCIEHITMTRYIFD